MKKLLTIVMTVSMLTVLLTACGSKKVEFKTYTPEDKSFTVDFPDSEPTVQDADLGITQMTTYTVSTKTTAYTVTKSDVPQESIEMFTIDEILTNSLNGAIANNNGQNPEFEDITISDLTAKSTKYTIEKNGATAYAQIQVVIKDDVLFSTMAIVQDDKDSTNETIDKFFGSFKLNEEETAE